MDTENSYKQPDSQDNSENISIWTPEVLVLLYCFGALFGLLLAINPHLSSLQTTNCLLLSWVLAIGALGMSMLADTDPVLEEEEEF